MKTSIIEDMKERSGILVSLLVSTLLFLNPYMATGQDSILVSGIITGNHSVPISGVTISIEGVYEAPEITDSSGRFQLVSPSGDEWLLIVPPESYKSRRIYLNSQREISLQLTPADIESGYDEVINKFRAEQRRDMLSSFYSPEPNKSQSISGQSIDQNLQGIVPGILSTVQSGMPGAGVTSYIRGIRSLYTNNQPLYIIDGLPAGEPGIFQSNLSGYTYNPLFTIDPLDITNITVLKDYHGSAIYGVRGSNGVVLIETLKPDEIQTRITASYRTGLSNEPRQITQLSSPQYKTLANEILMTSGIYEEDYRQKYSSLYITEDDPEYYKYDSNTNWQDEIFRNALVNDFYLRIQGGDEIARYGLSVSYLSHQGIIKQTDANRFNVRFVGNFNIFQWLSMDISSGLVNTQANIKESALSSQTSPILTAILKPPFLSPYEFDKNGGQLNTLEDVNSLGISNPVAVIDKFEGENTNSRFTISFRMEAKLWQEYLKLNSMVGIDLNSMSENVFMPNSGMELYYEGESWNAVKSMKNYLYSLYNDNFLSYRQEFKRRHLVTAAAGFRLHKNRFENDWGITKNAHESDEYNQLQDGVSYLREMGGENARWNRLGAYTSAGYTFRNKYFFDATLVPEFSSRTGQHADGVVMIGDNPYGLFYSIGAGWRLSGESIFSKMSWLEELKISASYGKTGNDDIGNRSALDYFVVVHYRETSGMIPGTITDQKLKFEETRQLNLGLDLGFFGNRVFCTFNLFNSKTEDLLVYEPHESFSGYHSLPSNYGEVSNKGWESYLKVRIMERNKFKWDMSINLAQINNTLNAIQNGEVISPFEGGQFIFKVGQSILSFYGYQYSGVYSTSEEASDPFLGGGLSNAKGVPFGAGDAKYNDLSGPDGTPDGIINEFDMTIIGSPVPNFFGGLQNTFQYGNWSLNASLQFVSGQEVFNYVRYRNESMSTLSNQSTSTLKRWTHEGQVSDVPRAVYMDPIGNSDFSTRWIEDGSYLRLKHLTLSYNLAEQLWRLRSLQVYFTATNMLTWSRYLGYDPEFSYSYSTVEQGIDYGMMPQTRQFILGVNIGL